MKTYRILRTIGGVILAASFAVAQQPPPAPPAPPAAPAPAPMPAAAPMAPIAPEPPMPAMAPMPAPAPQAAPMPPMPPEPPDPAMALQMAQDALDRVAPIGIDIDVQLSDLKAKLDNMNLDIQFPKDWPDVQLRIQDELNGRLDERRTQRSPK